MFVCLQTCDEENGWWILLCVPVCVNLSLLKNTVFPKLQNCVMLPLRSTPVYYQHLNPFNPSSASSFSHLLLFISLFIHLSTVYTVFLLTPHLHLPPCRVLGEQRPSAPDGLAPTAKMTNSPHRVRGRRGEAQRWERKDQEAMSSRTACKSFFGRVGFGCLMLYSHRDSVVN